MLGQARQFLKNLLQQDQIIIRWCAERAGPNLQQLQIRVYGWDGERAEDGGFFLIFENLEVGRVHDSCEEAIGVVHFAVVDDEGVIIGDDDEAEPAGLSDAGDFVGHAAGGLNDVAKVHDCDDGRLVLVSLEFWFLQLGAAVYFGDDQKLE